MGGLMPIKGNKMNDVIALLTQGETKMPLPYQQLASIIEPMTYHQQWTVREEYTQHVGWSLLTMDTALQLANICYGRRVADLGCGAGYLTYVLRKLGVEDITAYDMELHPHPFIEDIQQVDYTNIDLSQYDVILLSWPPYDEPQAALVAARIQPHQLLIYQGEGYGGCTGDDAFHSMLRSDFSSVEEFTVNLNARHLNFHGIYDSWTVYRKQSDFTKQRDDLEDTRHE